MVAVPPLAVDVDGTLTDDERAVDPRTLPVLRSWPAPVVIATGKAMPYPVALCEFAGIEPTVVAENGGVVVVGQTDALRFEGDRAAAEAVADALREKGYDMGWGPLDLANRWRETELAITRDPPLDLLRDLAADAGMRVIDSGYAYHVTDPDVDKAVGLRAVCDELDRDPSEFLVVGDSENDAPAFRIAGEAVAVANADDEARGAADRITDASFADGFLEAVAPYRE